MQSDIATEPYAHRARLGRPPFDIGRRGGPGTPGGPVLGAALVGEVEGVA
jgi:hypothetical protein